MINSHFSLNLLRHLSAISKYRNGISRSIGSNFTTLSESRPNYYDIVDKRNLAESSAFEKNDPRATWTNREETTTEDFLLENEHIKKVQRPVPVYRTCKITNHRSKVTVPISSLDSDDLVSGICYNLLGIETDIDLESLYTHLENRYSNKPNKELELSNVELDLLNDFQVQTEKLLHHRKLKMDHLVKILLVLDRIGCLSHQLRNLIQSHMMLNVHKFTPFQVITTFEVFGKHKTRYENFLNVLCLIFYDHMIPFLKPNSPGTDSSIEIRYVLHFLRVLKDFKFKKLTDVLYAQVYDNLDQLTTADMVEVSNTFFRNKKDPNFVELYTKMFSKIFKMPMLDFYNFEEYTIKRLNNDSDKDIDSFSGITNLMLDDLTMLKSIFNCSSEFLLSSVHQRIEFKRLWRHNIDTNNVSWRVGSSANDTSVPKEEDKPFSFTTGTDIVSYSMNFPDLYQKIEHLIMKAFKFQNHSREFVSNLIATVLDYSRYSNSPYTQNILINLYALLANIRGTPEEGVRSLELISPKTLLGHSHVYLYKIDPNCEFFKKEGINYYKPHLTTYTLFKGDHSLYSMLMHSYKAYFKNISDSTSKDQHLFACILLTNVLHPFYCSIRATDKPTLSLDLLHMSSNFNTKVTDLAIFTKNCKETIHKLLENGLSNDLIQFTEEAKDYITTILGDQFTLNERVKILKTLGILKICNRNLEYGPALKEFIDSSEGELLNYFKLKDREETEDGIKVAQDLELLDCLTDLMEVYDSEWTYDLLREILKTVYLRMQYYGIPELVNLSSCIHSSLSHLEAMDLENRENIENLVQNLRILKGETKLSFEIKVKYEKEINPDTLKVYNMLIKYHLF